MKINEIKVGSILSYLQMILGILVEIVYVPFLAKTLGQAEYGLYTTVNSSIAMLSILNLGFASGYIRYYSQYKKENDTDKISKLNGLFMIVFSVMGVVALVCGIYISANLGMVFSDGLTAGEYEIARILTILLTINLAISFPMTVFSSIISAHEKFVFLKLVGMLKTIGGPIVTLPILLMGYRSVGMVTATLAISLVADVCNCYFVFSKLKCKFVFRNFEKGLLKNIFVFTSFIAINLIVDQINTNINSVVLARYRGTSEVAIYGIGLTLYNCYKRFSTSITSVFVPRVHRIVTKYENNKLLLKQELTMLFTKVGRIQFLILGLIMTGFVFFGKHFINLWVGDGYKTSYYVALLLLTSSTIPMIQNIGIEIQRAENKHQFRSIVYLCMAIINLIMTIILTPIFGAVGAAIGTAFSFIVANGLIINIYYHRKCSIDILLFWKEMLMIMRGMVLPIICGVFMYNLWPVDSIVLFLAQIVIYSIVYIISMWLTGMNQYEKDLIKKPLERLVGKHHD